MSCIINSSFDGKPSVTHKALIDYYGDTPNGQIKAQEEFNKLTTPEFLSKFHSKDDIPWFKLQDGNVVDRERFTEQFEPALIKDTTGKLYYINHDGSRNYLAGKPLAWLSNKAKREFIDNVIFNALGGEVDLISNDFEDELSLAVDEVIENLSEYLEFNGGTDLDKQFIKAEVDKLMTARKLVKQDSGDANTTTYDNLDQENEESPEDDTRTSNEVVNVDSYLKNSKDTASANIKMMLSFIPNISSFSIDENGNPVIENAVSALGTETQEDISTYRDPHEIFRKIEDSLHDMFTQIDNEGKIVSVLDQMNTRLEAMVKLDPAIAYVKYYLDQFSDNKKIQFAQAFHKHYILFDTTDVSGTEGNFTYKVIDPTAASSKSFKIRQSWNELLSNSPYLSKQLDEQGLVQYTIDKVSVTKIANDLAKLGKEAVSKNGFDELGVELKKLNKALGFIGIDTNQLTEQHYQTMYAQMKAQLDTKEALALTPGRFVKTLINEVAIATNVLKSTNEAKLKNNSGFVNPLISSAIYKRISDSIAGTSDLVGESTVMIAGGKTAWSYSLPSYIDITVAKIKNSLYETVDADGNPITRNKFIEELNLSSEFYTRHPWINSLHNRATVNELKASTFSAFQKKGSSKYGKDNKNILFPDQLVDKIFKTLLPRVEQNSKAIFYTPAAADKGRLNAISGFDIFNVDITLNDNFGNPKVATTNLQVGNNALDVLVDNLESEYLRAKQAHARAIAGKDNTTDMVVHYDLKSVDGTFQSVNKDGVPVGNAIQIQSLPELSPYKFTDKKLTQLDFMFDESNKKLKQLMYAYNGNSVEFLLSDFDTEVNGTTVRQLLRDYLANKLDNRIKEAVQKLKDVGVVQQYDNESIVKNLKLDRRLWKNYADKYSLMQDKVQASENTLYALVADYTLNGMIANAGYNKIFAGDVAYYKDSVDYNKRIPATYTDGKYLMINKAEDINFNAAVVNNIIISAEDLVGFRDNFKKSIEAQVDLMDDETKKIYQQEFIDEKTGEKYTYVDNLAKSYVSQYEGVNATDAQSWISLDRWKFLKQKLGEWPKSADDSFKRLQNGTFTYEDLKFAAQPLKGVYFNQNSKTGIPTYLKYSQAVLIPSLYKGTQMENLVKAMTAQKVDEVITLDGVKVGALSPTTIADGMGNIQSKLKLNPYKLSNLHWKLQQQLPVKGMKNSMDVGSQLQKNIVSNIFADGQYGSRTGQQVIDDMNRIVSDLTLLAFNETVNELGLDLEGKIKDKAKFYDRLAKLALDKGVPAFAVEALNRGYEIDAIPQLRYKIQNVISAAFNNNIAKNQTPGGSFIQISNIGVTAQDVNKPNESGIFMLKDVNKLERPKFTTDVEGKAKVSSGQVFLPHTFIAKYIPNYATMSREDLLKMVDKELFNIIGYRIPNQKLSSNQPLEVVGILPPSMGDSIMMYSEITTQTGSDFDIDKTYVMLPAFDVKYSNKKDLIDTLFKMDDSDLLNMRQDIQDYQDYVRENPLPTDKINNPGSNKKQLINYLIDRGLISDDLSKKYVKGLRYVKPTNTTPNKKQLQNELFELYYEILSSPLSYVDMMSGIDGAVLKDEINRLHGTREELTSLQLLDPTYQLQIKFDNIGGKSGVGLTANQMVDHVYGQIAGSSMNSPVTSIIKSYIKTTDTGAIDLSQIFDTQGNKITDSISMFLNAYVDIAKDPYVTKGNFNSYTSNVTFLLLRAGMPLKHVISYVGQPILKDLIAEYESTLSSLPSTVNKRQTLNEAKEKVITNLANRVDEIIYKVNANNTDLTNQIADILKGAYNTQDEVFSKNKLDNALLNHTANQNLLKLLSGNIQNINAKYEQDPTAFIESVEGLRVYLQVQFNTVENFMHLQSAGEQLSEQVLISKADVNGGGHDIATHFVNNNRFNKVKNEKNFGNFDKKFDVNTMLGAKTVYTMKYMSKLDENLFITMDSMIKPVYPMVSRILKGDEYATNVEVVKRVEKSMYASLVQQALKGSPYDLTSQDMVNIFSEDKGIVSRISSAKLSDKYADNALIKALEIIKETEVDLEGKPTEFRLFLSVDNFTRKPDTILDDLSDAWQELLDSNDASDRSLAIDLVKYAIATSGLAKNRHSIFEFMPIEVADYMNRGIKKIKDTGLSDVFGVFIEDFLRHNQNADFRIKAKIVDLAAGVKGISAKNIGLEGIDSRIKLVRKNFTKSDESKISATKAIDSDKTKKTIENYKLFNDNGVLMRYIGDIRSLDGTGDIMVIAPTYSLGREIGNGNIYEYTSNNNTVFSNNKPANYKAIQDGIKKIKNELDFVEHTFNLNNVLNFYGQNIQVTEYDAVKAKEELIKKGLIKENKC